MKYTIYQDFRNQWRWYLTAADGERLATGEACGSRTECEEAIACTKAAGLSPLEEQEYHRPVLVKKQRPSDDWWKSGGCYPF